MPTPPVDDRRPDQDPGSTGASAAAGGNRVDPDRTPLNWLLLVPIVICLAVPLFNRTDPTLFGMPFFYWFQLAIIPIGVTCTVIVYRAHRRHQGGAR